MLTRVRSAFEGRKLIQDLVLPTLMLVAGVLYFIG
jgi:hypothetical protein